MQDAYLSEANQVGSWELIGYKMEDTNNFDYTEGTLEDGSLAISSLSAKQTWSAKNKASMNECGMGTEACEWTLTLNAANNGNGVAYTAGLSDDAKQLTPTFEKIGK